MLTGVASSVYCWITNEIALGRHLSNPWCDLFSLEFALFLYYLGHMKWFYRSFLHLTLAMIPSLRDTRVQKLLVHQRSRTGLPLSISLFQAGVSVNRYSNISKVHHASPRQSLRLSVFALLSLGCLFLIKAPIDLATQSIIPLSPKLWSPLPARPTELMFNSTCPWQCANFDWASIVFSGTSRLLTLKLSEAGTASGRHGLPLLPMRSGCSQS